MKSQRNLVLLLRFIACVLFRAFVAMLLPESVMVSSHAWLGLGEFPASPLVNYLTRSIAALYGFHGVLVMIVSRDVVRYKPIVTYLGGFTLVAATLLSVA